MFPKAMQPYPPIDLGSAGHDGFGQGFPLHKAKTLAEAEQALQNEHVVQLAYVEGHHDAAIRERHWGDIASFVVTGTLPWLSSASTKQQQTTQDDFLGTSGNSASPGIFASSQPLWSRLLGNLSGILFPVIVILILGLGTWLGVRIFQVPPCLPGVAAAACVTDVTIEVVTRIGLFLLYIVAVRVIATRY